MLFFLPSGQGWITVTDGTINSALHLQILKENVKTCDLYVRAVSRGHLSSSEEH